MTQLWGLNISGGEGGSTTANNKRGTPEANTRTDYVYPPAKYIDYIARRGMNFVRIPIVMARLIRNTPADDMADLTSIINFATSKGVTVLIDHHGAGPNTWIAKTGSGKVVGSSEEANLEFVEEWKAGARFFKQFPSVILGLLNEPHEVNAGPWLVAANMAIAAIRAEGANNLISVSGAHWDTASRWITTDNDTVMLGVQDPLNNYVYEVHQYLENGDMWSASTSPYGKGAQALVPVTQWARANGKRFILGEVGWAPDPYMQNEAKAILDYARANQDVWMGVAGWAISLFFNSADYYRMVPSGIGSYWEGPPADWSKVVDSPQVTTFLDAVPGPYLSATADLKAAQTERDAAKAQVSAIKGRFDALLGP
jgi:endoglucanase